MKLFFEYPNCTTCKRAKKFLKENGIEFKEISLKDKTPTKAQIKAVQGSMGIKRLFNTSGKTYRDLNLKENFENLSVDEAIKLLANDGSLVKRPVLIDEENKIFLIGFKEKDWNVLLKK
ncbi:Spx/MgsR family RNA polymerase-binding regulatory protein [Parvimonas sp. C2]|jgi:transcriptional regulator, spx/mgsR family|uniref:Spx/MgsR family RNA polymerase-binding regulatory protein n=1 Tax=Parvimonas sp. C2 TaxID=3110692 RepID=UPI002B4714B1|nr:Spx/MgsR family RNA polymerase-binding regulatory protein [Parvimonas sp. C2]MEB3073548.1 Spx/MgsR family RNA polymerase-binding regulatory protein [Parvimonas sp. C2]